MQVMIGGLNSIEICLCDFPLEEILQLSCPNSFNQQESVQMSAAWTCSFHDLVPKLGSFVCA